MARLIDAKELENQVKAAFSESNPVLMGQMLRWIRKQKTIDAVPVVRCKDCKWWKNEICTNVNGADCLVFNGNWFCASGERRSDD